VRSLLWLGLCGLGAVAVPASHPVDTAPAPVPAPPITVSAAISLTDVMEDLGRAYTAAGGGPVRFNFAGSNVLARQIAIGAPVDLFISADAAQMRVVEEAGRVVGTTVEVVGNRLAVVSATPDPGVRDVRDLADPRIRRIAIGDPTAVPAGVYARRYLQSIGLWDRVEDRVVPLGNVRAALAAVDTGSADAAIVYTTDVRAASRARLAFVVSGPDAPRIVYPAAVTARTPEAVAASRRFLEFLKTPTASGIFSRYGFEPLTGGDSAPGLE
jgi:molybdate transport system substrate-binding protein